MTEQAWLQATDPTPMLEFLRGKVSERKSRLFAFACWRRQWQGNDDEICRVIEVTSRYAEEGAWEPTSDSLRLFPFRRDEPAWDAAWRIAEDAARSLAYGSCYDPVLEAAFEEFDPSRLCHYN